MRHRITAKKRSQVRVYADLAREAGLSHPVGRAAYLVNRLDNAGVGSLFQRLTDWPEKQSRYEHEEQEFMARARVSTAKKWSAQFKAGVNLKKSIKGWAEWERAGQEPHGCYSHGAHGGTRADPYRHASRAEARNCWRRHCRARERVRRERAAETPVFTNAEIKEAIKGIAK